MTSFSTRSLSPVTLAPLVDGLIDDDREEVSENALSESMRSKDSPLEVDQSAEEDSCDVVMVVAGGDLAEEVADKVIELGDGSRVELGKVFVTVDVMYILESEIDEDSSIFSSSSIPFFSSSFTFSNSSITFSSSSFEWISREREVASL